MNYTSKNNNMEDNAAAEINEPAVAYRTGIVGNTFADSREPYRNRGFNDYDPCDDDDDDEPLTPEQEEAIRNDPAFIAWKEGIIQSILKGVEDVKAGRGRPIEEWWQDFKRRVENGEL